MSTLCCACSTADTPEQATARAGDREAGRRHAATLRLPSRERRAARPATRLRRGPRYGSRQTPRALHRRARQPCAARNACSTPTCRQGRQRPRRSRRVAATRLRRPPRIRRSATLRRAERSGSHDGQVASAWPHCDDLRLESRRREPTHQIAGIHVEASGQLEQVVEADVALASLYLADERPVRTASIRKCFLADAQRFTVGPDPLTQGARSCRYRRRHGSHDTTPRLSMSRACVSHAVTPHDPASNDHASHALASCYSMWRSVGMSQYDSDS